MEHMEQLTPRAAQIMDLAIQGLGSGDIAKRLELTQPYVCVIMGAGNFQHQLAIRREKLENRIDDKVANATVEAGDVLKDASIQAARKLVALVENDNNPIALRASESVLDRVGVSKKTDGGARMTQQVVIIDDKTARMVQETLEMEKAE